MQRPRLRYVVYSGLVTASVLGLLELGARVLERTGLVDTFRPDSAASYVEHPIFERKGAWIRVSPDAQRKMSPAEFRMRAPGWRDFAIGGSFLWGFPWSRAGQHDAGSIPFWLRAELLALHPSTTMEVVNIAANGVPSYMEREFSQMVLELDPDLLLVASCNNEGGPEPSEVQKALHQLGGFRLLASVVAKEPRAEERKAAPLPLEEVERVRGAFRANLESMAAMTEEAGVPLLLTTLPANFRYDQMEFVAGLPGMTRDGLPDCARDGYRQAYVGDFAAARRTFSGCSDVPEVAQWLALRDLQEGRPAPRPDPLEALWGSCVSEGVELYYGGQHASAVERLGGCDDNVPEALRWIGLAQLALGQIEAARTTLEQSIEVFPRVRCRPSMNAIIREVAAEHAHVHLVDLDEASRALAPGGIPGYEQFVDNNHMHWSALARMADEILRVMEEEALVPRPEHGETIRRPDRAKLAAAAGLPPDLRAIPVR